MGFNSLRPSGLLVVAWAFVAGCTVNATSTSNVCQTDASVVCATGTVGYSCSGEMTPVASNTSLSCGQGLVEADGETSYCCAAQTTACVADPNAGCTNGSTGYACSGADAPNVADPLLACGAGVASANGDSLYCCVSVSSTSCTADASVVGCTDGSYGFSCTSTDTPSAGNPALNCSEPVAGANNASLYCCVGFDSSTSSCSSDPNVLGCTGGSYGFSCTSTDTPDQTQTSLVCSTSSAGPNNELIYCCSNK